MARILVIDDDEHLLRMVGLMLKRGGHVPVLISDPVRGLEEIRKDRPDLLLLDVMMPVMNGYEVTRAVRDNPDSTDLPIIIITARGQDSDRDFALENGADDYLSKPVTLQQLIEHVDVLLKKQKRKIAKTPTSGQPAVASGKVISVFGLRGGVGRTSVAVNLAIALRRAVEDEVSLVDLSPSVGHAVLHLRLKVRETWQDLADGFDWTAVEDSLLLHPSTGVRVLPAPTSPVSVGALSADKTQTLINTFRQNSAFTVLDLPSMLTPSVETALAQSDTVIQVVSPDVTSVESAIQLNQALKKMDIQPKQQLFLLNNPTPKAHLPKNVVERGLNARMSLEIPYDINQARAITRGIPLCANAAPSAMADAIRLLADNLAAQSISNTQPAAQISVST